MRALRFEKPSAKTGEEYGLYLTFEDRQKLITALKDALQAYGNTPLTGPEAWIYAALQELENPS